MRPIFAASLIGFCCLLSNAALSDTKIKGRVLLRKSPVKGVRVTAFDREEVGADQYIGRNVTGTDGKFSIRLKNKTWDEIEGGLGRIVPWWDPEDPDIYIQVEMSRADSDGNIHWYLAYESATENNHPPKEPLNLGSIRLRANECGLNQPIECSDPALVRAVGAAVMLGATWWGHNVFDGACRRHDLCYRHGYTTYHYDRNHCDDEFKRLLGDRCDQFGAPKRNWCNAAKAAFVEGVRRMGDSAFLTNGIRCDYERRLGGRNVHAHGSP